MKKLLLISCASVALMVSTPAQAGPLVTAIAGTAQAAFTGAGLLGGKLAAGLGITSGFGLLAVDFAVRATLGYALNALSSRPNDINRGYSRSVNQVGPALPHQIIYGETVVGGAVFYQTNTTGSVTNDRLHRCIAFAGHEIDSYQAIYLNDQEVTLDGSGNVTAPAEFVGHVRIKQYLGTDSQTADSDLVSEVSEWTTDHRARGIAYLYVRFEGASNFPNGLPTVSAKIRGKKVLDTRTSTTAWSDNPAMCIRDYLLESYGLEESSSNIDDTLFEAAADYCDGGGTARFTCNGSFDLEASPEEIIRNMLSSMGGTFWNYAGNWAVLAAEYQTPTQTFTRDDLRGPIQLATRHSRRDNFNSVRGQYKGAETDYQPDDYTEITSQFYIDEDGGIKTASELNLLFTDNEVMAQRIGRTFLRRNRFQQTIAGSFGLRALNLKVGDNIFLTIPEIGYSAKVFEVVDWRLGIDENEILVNMLLREMSETVYTGIVDTLTDESLNELEDESGNTLEAVVS